jgi:hypothetical protein
MVKTKSAQRHKDEGLKPKEPGDQKMRIDAIDLYATERVQDWTVRAMLAESQRSK